MRTGWGRLLGAAVLTVSCSSSSSGGSTTGDGGTSGGDGGSSGGTGSGTGLALGTACIQVGSASEQCFQAKDLGKVERSSTGMTVQYQSAASKAGPECGPSEAISLFSVRVAIPSGTTSFPFSAADGDASLWGTVNSNSCQWGMSGNPQGVGALSTVTGSVFADTPADPSNTLSPRRMEADVTFTIKTETGTALTCTNTGTKCGAPHPTLRFRFNVTGYLKQ